jgi:tRNA-2-methylthio-N6-dimethylallyladenosine synthase
LRDRVIAAIAECPKVMPQVHLPMQSANDRILESMQRTYTYAEYLQVVARLRAAVPGLALSTDLIVGFPGETEAEFEETLAAVESIRFDSAFLFKYSARPDTRAWRWEETVDEDEKGRRLSRLIDLQHRISGERNEALIGREVEVLVESIARRDATQLFGRTEDFKAVVFPDDGTPPGSLRRLRVVGATPVTLFGEPLAERAAAPALVQLG